MTTREEAILWLNSFVKNKEPMTLIPKQLIRLMHDALTEQPDVVRCKDCINFGKLPIDHHGHQPYWCKNLNIYSEGPDWFCADGERKEDDA